MVAEYFSVKNVPCISSGAVKEKDLRQLGALVARQTFGFDFIFTKRKTGVFPICVEINGCDSGIDGLYSLFQNKLHANPADRILARRFSLLFARSAAKRMVAAKSGNKLLQFFDFQNILSDLLMIIYEERLWRKRRYKDLEKKNPAYFFNKSIQKEVIDEMHRIPQINSFKELDNYDYVIVKPVLGCGGKGMIDFESSHIALFEYVQSKHYVVEPLIDAFPAEFAPESHKKYRASMRLFSNIRFYRKRDDIIAVPEFVLAYQRVAQNDYTPIVNMSKGAYPVPASQREFELAWPAAKKIASNVTKACLKVSDVRFLR